METSEDRHVEIAALWAVIFATFGILTAFFLLSMIGGVGFIANILMPVLVAVIALYAAAAVFGSVAGLLIYRLRSRVWAIRSVSVVLAWLCLITSCLAGSSVSFLSTNGTSYDFEAYIFRPLFWVMFFGMIPALILGLAYSAVIRERLFSEI